MHHSLPLFSLFSSFEHLTIHLFIIIFCQSLDSNCGPQVLEATSLPTEPQSLPIMLSYVGAILCTEQQVASTRDTEKVHSIILYENFQRKLFG